HGRGPLGWGCCPRATAAVVARPAVIGAHLSTDLAVSTDLVPSSVSPVFGTRRGSCQFFSKLKSSILEKRTRNAFGILALAYPHRRRLINRGRTGSYLYSVCAARCGEPAH